MADHPSTIAPDTKDWTWTLQRPCAECGFEAGAVAAQDISRLTLETTEPVAEVLARPDAAERPAPAGLVAAGVRLPRARRVPGLRRPGCT